MKLSVLLKCLIRTSRISILLVLLQSNYASSQGCESTIKLILNNIKGGVYSNQTVTFKGKSSGDSFTKKTDGDGTVSFDLPCDQTFDVTISNYTREVEMHSPANAGSRATRKFGYEPNMAEKDKSFAMNDVQKSAVDMAAEKLPEISLIKGSRMAMPRNMSNYSSLSITLKDLDNGPLVGEQVTLTGEKRNKSFKGKTNSAGTFSVFLPKGDKYSINFTYNKNYSSQEIFYSKGTSDGRINLSYIGTEEILRRKKIEEERIKAEEERLAKEHAKFVAWCKDLGISEEEGYRKKTMESMGSTPDTVVLAALRRNKWTEKLIVCDLTGSMNPYAGQLSIWYQLHYKKEPNVQFVFFNDGDSKSDDQKVIGSTGGIYYQESKGMDSLINLMSKVQRNGYGGDCPENNMEALIKGVKMAKPYKELVMIVDNNAPVKDIVLLKNFKHPVHIILCGSRDGWVLIDYLAIAWKTKGSIHTMEEDITKIAAMSEGESIQIEGATYKLMGGEFVQIKNG
ncbi:MAG: hypothetical protein ACI837_003508 [Crocinitomicaceae bacterium]|jgi:hypothetical protein